MSVQNARERAISELAEALKVSRAGLFVGSGISSISGLPSWKMLLGELIDRLDGQPGLEPGIISDAKLLLEDKSKWLTLAQLLKRELGQVYTDYITERFTDNKIKPNKVHEAFVELDWKVIVTTNYDRLIERAFAKKFGDEGDIPVFTFSSAPKIASNYRRGSKFILKAHGDAREAPESIVLTETDYRHLVHREIGYQTILQAIFTTNSFLFIGFSLTDPDLHLLLSFLHSAFHGDTPIHYALMPENERLNAEDKVYYDDFRIHIIPIKPTDREGDTLLFLSDLKNALATK